jgi:hypothetical protein
MPGCIIGRYSTFIRGGNLAREKALEVIKSRLSRWCPVTAGAFSRHQRPRT